MLIVFNHRSSAILGYISGAIKCCIYKNVYVFYVAAPTKSIEEVGSQPTSEKLDVSTTSGTVCTT